MSGKQTVISAMNKLTDGHGQLLYDSIVAAVSIAMSEYHDDRISKNEAERIYGKEAVKVLESSELADGLFYRMSGAKNAKKFFSRKKIEAALMLLGYPKHEDPTRRKRPRYSRPSKTKAAK